MNVTLCNNKSELNIINKSITTVKTINDAVIKGDISHEAPILLLTFDADTASQINYMKIPEFNRSYFITDIINLTGNRYEVRGRVDVLESFKNSILGLSAVIDKQSGMSVGNLYLDDGSFVSENKEFNTVINFSGGFNASGEYILITAGGGGGII